MTSIIVKLYKELNDSEFDRTVDLERLEEFPRDDDSTFFSRNRQKRKIRGFIQKRRGRITGETIQIVKFLPTEKTNVFISTGREFTRGEKAKKKQVKPK